MEINNSFYDTYGEQWYSAWDNPVAILRAENKAKFPWILNHLRELCSPHAAILDVGCGGGFLSNELARQGYSVTGIDKSPESIRTAGLHDSTGKVQYLIADAYELPFPNESFDVITAMDFLEHVDRPQDVIAEFSRVLKPKGYFFFHTFNRNPISHLVAIKLLEWFIKNTPKNMHVINLFIKPKELKEYCERAQMRVLESVGIRPVISSIDWKMVRTGVVSKHLEFKLTKRKLISYIGIAKKELLS